MAEERGLYRYTGLIEVEIPIPVPPMPPPAPGGFPGPPFPGDGFDFTPFETGVQPGDCPIPGGVPPVNGNAGNYGGHIWDLDRLTDWLASTGLSGVPI